MFEGDLTAAQPPDQPAQSAPPPSALADWKAALRSQFEQWLESITEVPPAQPEELPDEPDLYSFYEQLAAANVENRKANRRTAEAFSQWSETLARFESQLGPLRDTTAQLAAAQPKERALPRPYCLLLVEFLDRLYRLEKAFAAPPLKSSWWRGHDAAWRQAWERQRQGLAILISHLDELLKKEGVVRIETVGRPFDPTLMTAVATEPNQQRPPQTVLEEIAPGYSRQGELLRTAQVKVSTGL